MATNLYELKKGQTAKIIEFKSNEISLNSAKFGITVGHIIKCVEKFGNIVIQKKHQQIAIAKKLSKEIIVEVIK